MCATSQQFRAKLKDKDWNTLRHQKKKKQTLILLPPPLRVKANTGYRFKNVLMILV